jgi:hypothetical protein
MEWYYYVSGFFAGVFLANSIPHFVKGICGDKLPTPFSKPPGKGLSSPLVNVIWALINIVIGYVLYRLGKVSMQDNLSLGIFFAAFALKSIMGGRNFTSKHKE